MEKQNHECIIGQLLTTDSSVLITINDLVECVKEKAKMKDNFIKYGIQIIDYTMQDYLDRRKSTNLTRFKYCPYCGKIIDWRSTKNFYKQI